MTELECLKVILEKALEQSHEAASNAFDFMVDTIPQDPTNPNTWVLQDWTETSAHIRSAITLLEAIQAQSLPSEQTKA